MEGWSALQSWPSLYWWSQHHGHRTVPVELGTDSTHTWRETTLLLHSFMKDYMQPSVESMPHAEVAYIAQHPLFDQMPSLLSDFHQPELMGGTAMQMNAWIGTKGTVTPLHFDSYDNFFAQVGLSENTFTKSKTVALWYEKGDISMPGGGSHLAWGLTSGMHSRGKCIVDMTTDTAPD